MSNFIAPNIQEEINPDKMNILESVLGWIEVKPRGDFKPQNAVLKPDQTSHQTQLS